MPDPVPRTRPPLWATIVATSFGAGFMPKAPGHTGTLTAVPLAWALSRLGTLAYVAPDKLRKQTLAPKPELLVIDGLGHDLPPGVWTRMADAIAQTVRRAEAG